jgi:hypothetical protein
LRVSPPEGEGLNVIHVCPLPSARGLPSGQAALLNNEIGKINVIDAAITGFLLQNIVNYHLDLRLEGLLALGPDW